MAVHPAFKGCMDDLYTTRAFSYSFISGLMSSSDVIKAVLAQISRLLVVQPHNQDSSCPSTVTSIKIDFP